MATNHTGWKLLSHADIAGFSITDSVGGGCLDGVDLSASATGGSLDHTKLLNIGTLTHATIDSYLNQAVKTTSTPTFTALTLGNPTTGSIEFYDGRFYITGTATQRAIDRTGESKTTTTTVANTTTETILHTESLLANTMKPGRIYKLHCDGVCNNATAADDLTFNLYFGGTLAATYNPAMGALPANTPWRTDINITIRTIGESGTCATHSCIEINGFSSIFASLPTINTTEAETIELKVQWGAAKPANTISIYQGYLELKN